MLLLEDKNKEMKDKVE